MNKTEKNKTGMQRYTDVKWARENTWAIKLQICPICLKVLAVMKDLAALEAQVQLEHAKYHTPNTPTSTKIIVTVEVPTTNLNKLHIIDSYKLSRKHCFTTLATCLNVVWVLEA